MSEINNTEIDNVKNIDIVLPMYNLIEYSDNYAEPCESLWHHYRDESVFANGAIVNFPSHSNSGSFKFKTKIAGRTEDDGTKNVKIRVLLKYLNNLWRTLEIPLLNCETKLF